MSPIMKLINYYFFLNGHTRDANETEEKKNRNNKNIEAKRKKKKSSTTKMHVVCVNHDYFEKLWLFGISVWSPSLRQFSFNDIRDEYIPMYLNLIFAALRPFRTNMLCRLLWP